MSTPAIQATTTVDENPPNDSPLLDTDDVTELIETIKTAASSELLYGSSVFDSSAMAPVSPAAAVSFQLNNC